MYYELSSITCIEELKKQLSDNGFVTAIHEVLNFNSVRIIFQTVFFCHIPVFLRFTTIIYMLKFNVNLSKPNNICL